MLQLKFNPGLTLTGFRTTRPCIFNFVTRLCKGPIEMLSMIILNFIMNKTLIDFRYRFNHK